VGKKKSTGLMVMAWADAVEIESVFVYAARAITAGNR
jgi:hypothetical protein